MHSKVSLNVILIFIIVTRSTADLDRPSNPWILTASPVKLENIIVHLPYTVELVLRYNETLTLDDEILYVVKVSSINQITLDLKTSAVTFSGREIKEGCNKTLEMTGNVIGYADLNFYLEPQEGQRLIPLLLDYRVTVIRRSNALDVSFTAYFNTI